MYLVIHHFINLSLAFTLISMGDSIWRIVGYLLVAEAIIIQLVFLFKRKKSPESISEDNANNEIQ